MFQTGYMGSGSSRDSSYGSSNGVGEVPLPVPASELWRTSGRTGKEGEPVYPLPLSEADPHELEWDRRSPQGSRGTTAQQAEEGGMVGERCGREGDMPLSTGGKEGAGVLTFFRDLKKSPAVSTATWSETGCSSTTTPLLDLLLPSSLFKGICLPEVKGLLRGETLHFSEHWD